MISILFFIAFISCLWTYAYQVEKLGKEWMTAPLLAMTIFFGFGFYINFIFSMTHK